MSWIVLGVGARASATLSAGQQEWIGVSDGEAIAPDAETCEQAVIETVDYVTDVWHKPDSGI